MTGHTILMPYDRKICRLCGLAERAHISGNAECLGDDNEKGGKRT